MLGVPLDALESGDSVRGWLVAIGLTEAARMVLVAVAIWFVVRWWVAEGSEVVVRSGRRLKL